MKCNIYNFLSGHRVAMGALCLLLFASIIAVGDDSASDAERSKEWERAAVNYEWAAMAQQDAAQTMFSEGRLLRDAVYEDESERVCNLLAAASRESRAAGLEAAAGSSFDKAANCWTRVSDRYNVNTAQVKQSDQMANIAKQKAIIAYKRAVELYELSAQAYSVAGQPLKQAGLSKKAAAICELLAKRNYY